MNKLFPQIESYAAHPDTCEFENIFELSDGTEVNQLKCRIIFLIEILTQTSIDNHICVR